MDSGNLSSTADKLDIITSIMSALKYDAIGMGTHDIRLGDDFFTHTAEKGLVVLDASPEARESTVPYLIKNVDGVRVGVISFSGEITTSAPSGTNYVRRKALYSAYKAARDGSDVLILLDQANRATKDWIERNGPRLGTPDVVIGGVARTRLAREEVVGKTRIVPTAAQGKNVGVVDVTIASGQDPKIECRTISLDRAVPEDEAVAKQVTDFVLNSKSQSAATRSQRSPYGSSSVSTGKPYYPPGLCKACHVSQYEDWQKTRHAGAIKSLVTANRTVPECLPCHSEMFRTVRTAQVPKNEIGGVECATCHTGAIPHGAERRTAAARTKVDRSVCLECHTKERSPDYDEKTYFSKIAHKGPAAATGTASAPNQ